MLSYETRYYILDMVVSNKYQLVLALIFICLYSQINLLVYDYLSKLLLQSINSQTYNIVQNIYIEVFDKKML